MKLTQKQLRLIIEAEVDKMRLPHGANSHDDDDMIEESDFDDDDDKSKLTINLDRKSLFRSDTASLLRLAAFLELDVPVSKDQNETDAQFRSRLILLIQRREKHIKSGVILPRL